jgi:signal transduction histidine kinase
MRGLRRRAPELLVAVLILLLLASYVAYTRMVVNDLRREAARSSRMSARVFRALNDTSETENLQAIFDLARGISEQGVPMIVSDASGRPSWHANLPEIPGTVPANDPRVVAAQAKLDRQNPPVIEPGIGTVHFGHTRLVRWLQIIPALQAVVAAMLVALGFWLLRSRHVATRERLWAGMARESAHQLGTPLSSLAGWVELLSERDGDATTQRALGHMRLDLERLDRVAHRFERIGRETKQDRIDIRVIVDRVVDYFRPRVPTLANTIELEVVHEGSGPLEVQGDAVLAEWALEVLVKNAIDALAGRGGRLVISTAPIREGARVRVADDGPGVPRELRERIFEPGFSTKSKGWGIGLALAKRIAEENHGGRLTLLPTERGATFEIMFR